MRLPEQIVGTAIVDPLGDDPGAEMEKLHRGGALIRDRLDFLSTDDRDWLLFRTAEQTLFRAKGS